MSEALKAALKQGELAWGARAISEIIEKPVRQTFNLWSEAYYPLRKWGGCGLGSVESSVLLLQGLPRTNRRPLDPMQKTRNPTVDAGLREHDHRKGCIDHREDIPVPPAVQACIAGRAATDLEHAYRLTIGALMRFDAIGLPFTDEAEAVAGDLGEMALDAVDLADDLGHLLADGGAK